MKVFQVIAAASLFVAAAVGAQAASFIGQTVDGALIAGPDMSVTTQFRSPITAPGTFDGVMQDNFDDTWNVTLQVLSTEVIVGWTGTGDGNIGGPSNLVTVDLSGYTNGAILGLDSYSCAPSGNFPCTALGGPLSSITSLTSTSTSFDVSFEAMRSGETYVFGTPAVPEPSTWAMMLLGFAGLGFAGYRTARRGASA
jgi:hypothetical protein